MTPWISCLLAVVAIQIALISAEEGSACDKITNIPVSVKGKRRWYYCKTSSDEGDNGCFIDVDPQSDGSKNYKRTRYNNSTKKVEVQTFTAKGSEDNDVQAKNVYHVQTAFTSDENCMTVLKCWRGIRPFVLFVCRTKEACQDDTYQEFLDTEMSKLKKFETVRTNLKKLYDENLCGE